MSGHLRARSEDLQLFMYGCPIDQQDRLIFRLVWGLVYIATDLCSQCDANYTASTMRCYGTITFESAHTPFSHIAYAPNATACALANLGWVVLSDGLVTDEFALPKLCGTCQWTSITYLQSYAYESKRSVLYLARIGNDGHGGFLGNILSLPIDAALKIERAGIRSVIVEGTPTNFASSKHENDKLPRLMWTQQYANGSAHVFGYRDGDGYVVCPIVLDVLSGESMRSCCAPFDLLCL